MELTLQQPTKFLLLYFINNLPLFDILKGSICPFQRRKLSQWFRYYRLFNLCWGPFSDNDRAFLFNTWKLCTVVCCCSVYKYASRYITLSLYIQSWDSIKRAVAAFELFQLTNCCWCWNNRIIFTSSSELCAFLPALQYSSSKTGNPNECQK